MTAAQRAAESYAATQKRRAMRGAAVAARDELVGRIGGTHPNVGWAAVEFDEGVPHVTDVYDRAGDRIREKTGRDGSLPVADSVEGMVAEACVTTPGLVDVLSERTHDGRSILNVTTTGGEGGPTGDVRGGGAAHDVDDWSPNRTVGDKINRFLDDSPTVRRIDDGIEAVEGAVERVVDAWERFRRPRDHDR